MTSSVTTAVYAAIASTNMEIVKKAIEKRKFEGYKRKVQHHAECVCYMNMEMMESMRMY